MDSELGAICYVSYLAKQSVVIGSSKARCDYTVQTESSSTQVWTVFLL